jgi:hypothetical protein
MVPKQCFGFVSEAGQFVPGPCLKPARGTGGLDGTVPGGEWVVRPNVRAKPTAEVGRLARAADDD